MPPNAQPVLPSETILTDVEELFASEQPRNLWPSNQNSNAGLLRRVTTLPFQDALDTLAALFDESFVETASGYLSRWEGQVGLPASSGLIDAVRRSRIASRRRLGPFTRSRRRDIVESFITATFGSPTLFSLDGIPLTGAGVPLFAEVAPVNTLYSIRENGPYGTNLIPNPGFETDITGWNSDGTVLSGARSTAQSKFGAASLTGISNSANPYMYWQTPLIPISTGAVYTLSGWFFSPTRTLSASVIYQWFNASGVAVGGNVSSPALPVIPANRWTFMEFTMIAPVGATQARPLFQFYGSTAGDVLYLDGVQLEVSPLNAQGKNLMRGGSFDTAVDWSFWFRSAGVSMSQDNFHTHDGPYAEFVSFPATLGSYILNFNTGIYGKRSKGRTFTASAWVYGSGGAIGSTLRIQFNETGGVIPEEGVIAKDTVLVAGWQRISVTGTIVRDDRTSLNVYLVNSFGVVFSIWLDSVQVEEGAVATTYEDTKNATAFVDPQKTPFYYEVRVKNTITPDVIGLTRELDWITPGGISYDVFSVADV